LGDFKPHLGLSLGALNQIFDPAAERAAWLRYPGPFRNVVRPTGMGYQVNEGPTYLVVNDTATGRRLFDTKIEDRDLDIKVVGFASEARRVAVKAGPKRLLGLDGWFRVYDSGNGNQMWELENEPWSDYPAHEFAPDGRSLAVYTRSEKWQTLTLRDADTGKILHTPFHAPATGFLRVVAQRWSMDGKQLAAVIRPVEDRKPVRLIIWSATTGQRVWELSDAWDAHDIAFSPDGSTLALCTFGGSVVLLDAANGRPLQ
ncbi:MAG: WD40 repeat domain-containing protein, partial [Gemmataceae bacterium]